MKPAEKNKKIKIWPSKEKPVFVRNYLQLLNDPDNTISIPVEPIEKGREI